jgi:hypothetical protein
MAQDEILKEVRAIREAYGDRFGFDIRALYRDAKERERKAQRPTVALPLQPAVSWTSPAGPAAKNRS